MQLVGAGIRGQGSSKGKAERPLLRRDGRPVRPAITQEQHEALYFQALRLLAQITKVHIAIAEGHSEEVERIGREFEEDRHLLEVLALTAPEFETALTDSSDELKGSLQRVKDHAAAELAVGSDAATQDPAHDRARLAIKACSRILGS